VVGLRTPGEHVATNFGGKDFVFDVELYVKVLYYREQRHTIFLTLFFTFCDRCNLGTSSITLEGHTGACRIWHLLLGKRHGRSCGELSSTSRLWIYGQGFGERLSICHERAAWTHGFWCQRGKTRTR
jgi:hypothetical protein